MIKACEAEHGKMYTRTKKGPMEGNTWYTRPKLTAKQYVNRLEVRLNSCNGRDIWMINTYRNDPERYVLFIRHDRGEEQFGGRYEHTSKVLVPVDTNLRAIKWKPGFKAVPKSTPTEKTGGDRRTGIIGTRSEAGDEDGVIKSNPLAALRQGVLEVEDALQTAVDQAIEEVGAE